MVTKSHYGLLFGSHKAGKLSCFDLYIASFGVNHLSNALSCNIVYHVITLNKRCLDLYIVIHMMFKAHTNQDSYNLKKKRQYLAFGNDEYIH